MTSAIRTRPVGTAQDYLAEVRSCWEGARAGRDTIELDVGVAGVAIRLCFAEPALHARLAPAFEHRRTTSRPDPDLSIMIWAGRDHAIQTPPWCRPGPVLRGSLDHYSDGARQMVFRHENRFSALDHASGTGFQWYDDAARISSAEAANPLRYFFHWWMLREGHALCHAASVGTPAGAVLICGASGAGKSTTTLACVDAGLLYVGDDLVLVRREPEARVVNLYGSAKLNADCLPLFPRWAAHVDNPVRAPGEKAVFFLNRFLPDRIASSLPLAAIVLPQITGRRLTTVERASPAACLRSLAPSSVMQLCGDGPALLRELAQLAREVPGYALKLGTDQASTVEAVTAIASGRSSL